MLMALRFFRNYKINSEAQLWRICLKEIEFGIQLTKCTAEKKSHLGAC